MSCLSKQINFLYEKKNWFTTGERFDCAILKYNRNDMLGISVLFIIIIVDQI